MLLDLSLNELTEKIVKDGFAKFRAKQLFDAMQNAKKLEEISNLPKDFLTFYKDEYPNFEIIKCLTSNDGTKKYLFKMNDGCVVEGVFLPYSYGNTFCVSTQVGCRMGCSFCASTLSGLERNLSSGEMLGMILFVNALNKTGKDRAITNVVLMGSGEPLDNYNEVMRFLRHVSSPDGICISPRNITLSTCGIVPKIYELANENLPINLTLSLHAPTDEMRKQIMKIANAYTISETILALENYFETTKRRVSIEYSLILGFNDTEKCINDLIKLLKGLPFHVNLIPLNDVKERNLEGSSKSRAYQFMEALIAEGINATVRRTMGEDIEGACGQLRSKFVMINTPASSDKNED